MNVGLAATRSARRYPDAIAAFDSVSELTWQDVERRSNRLANALLGALNPTKGDRVALWAPNRVEVPEILAGIAKAGLTYVGLNFRMSDTDLLQVLDNADPRALIVAGEFYDRATAIVSGREVQLYDLDGSKGEHCLRTHTQRASSAPPPTLHEIRPDDDFCIVYTSGTTGTPKGVWFDHGRVLQHATVAALEYEISQSSRYLMAIPHNSSVNITLVPCMTMGAAMGFIDSRSFDAGAFVDTVQMTRSTHSYLVPTQLYRLLDTGTSADRLGSMSTLGYGAAPMSPDKAGELLDRYGPIFNQLYGMAEIASIGTMLRKPDHVAAMNGRPELLRSAGQASYAIDVRVVSQEGKDVEPGERGEVIFAAPYMMKGYYRDSERTRSALRNGWIHSGDIAEIDSDGFIYIVDRIKDLIIRGGFNIAPVEIESALHRHPDVLEVGVIGVPDEEWGESIVAFVSPKKEGRLDEGELIDWCRDIAGLGSLKMPKEIRFLSSLPKNAVGKIAKDELRRQFGLPQG